MMSLARWIGKAALVAALFTVAHAEANALTRKAAYKPTESLRPMESLSRAYIIDWRVFKYANLKAAFAYTRDYVDPLCLIIPVGCR
jgi:hypothetical protein